MLVLSRKQHEEIIIGDGPNQIRIVVVKVNRGVTRLGIVAPRDMNIRRSNVKPQPGESR